MMLLDFARGRLGGGRPLKLTKELLEPCLRQIIEELQAIYPARKIEATFDLQEPVAPSEPVIGFGQVLFQSSRKCPDIWTLERTN